MARTKITQEKIIEMNELYLKLKTYAAVSRAMGGSPSPTTVKKYIIPNYVSQDSLILVHFYELPECDCKFFLRKNNWGDLCELSDEEKVEVEELWKEISV